MNPQDMGGMDAHRPVGPIPGRLLSGCVLMVVLVVVLVGLIGCGSPPPPPPPPSSAAQEQVRVMPVVSEDVREKLLDGAVAVLDRLDDYDEESAFAQVFDRLNQWSHAAVIAGAPLAANWNADPLLAALPDRLRAGTTAESLGSAVFDAATDIQALRTSGGLPTSPRPPGAMPSRISTSPSTSSAGLSGRWPWSAIRRWRPRRRLPAAAGFCPGRFCCRGGPALHSGRGSSSNCCGMPGSMASCSPPAIRNAACARGFQR